MQAQYNLPPQARQWIEQLGLRPHPEGGFFTETYKADEWLPGHALPARYGGQPRALATNIYFLLTNEIFSAFHRLQSDELWYHHDGGGVTIEILHPDGTHEQRRLGPDPAEQGQPHIVVPRQTWFAAHVDAGVAFALVCCASAPGYEDADMALAERETLIATYPQHRDLITRYTRTEADGWQA
jgi:hypothetical protein